MINDLIPEQWRDYELLDCGNQKKLEKFGPNILIRPEPEAIWSSKLSNDEWHGSANAIFEHDTSGKGKWKTFENCKKSWRVNFGVPAFKISCEAKLGRFKNIGLFPEQAPQWEYIHDSIKSMGQKRPKVINLFAHTGLSSIVAAKAGAEVYHVEGAKPFISWANENAELNKVSNIHWVLEDVIKFLKREQKRGHFYHGVIADPPSFGSGPGKEKWVLETHLPLLIQAINNLLAPEKHFLVLNTYGHYLSPNTLYTLVQSTLRQTKSPETGMLTLKSNEDHYLTMGTYLRHRNF